MTSRLQVVFWASYKTLAFLYNWLDLTLGSNTDLTVSGGDALRLYSSMPVLEDGLSSGHASDTDNNNPTVILMKKQITEIEREINHGTFYSTLNF